MRQIDPHPPAPPRPSGYSDREEGETPAGNPNINPIFSIAFSVDPDGYVEAVTEHGVIGFLLDELPVSSPLYSHVHTYIEPPDDGEWHDLPDA